MATRNNSTITLKLIAAGVYSKPTFDYTFKTSTTSYGTDWPTAATPAYTALTTYAATPANGPVSVHYRVSVADAGYATPTDGGSNALVNYHPATPLTDNHLKNKRFVDTGLLNYPYSTSGLFSAAVLSILSAAEAAATPVI